MNKEAIELRFSSEIQSRNGILGGLESENGNPGSHLW